MAHTADDGSELELSPHSHSHHHHGDPDPLFCISEASDSPTGCLLPQRDTDNASPGASGSDPHHHHHHQRLLLLAASQTQTQAPQHAALHPSLEGPSAAPPPPPLRPLQEGGSQSGKAAVPAGWCSATRRAPPLRCAALCLAAAALLCVHLPARAVRGRTGAELREARLEASAGQILRRYLLREDSVVRNGSSAPGERGLCRSNAELFPGHVSLPEGAPSVRDAEWVPHSGCRLRHYGVEGARDCMRGAGRVVLYGDSLMGGVALAMGFKLNVTEVSNAKELMRLHPEFPARHNLDFYVPGGGPDPALQFFWTQSAKLMDPTSPDRKNASQALSEADVVILHHALWDLGNTCTGVYSYYHTLKERIVKMKRFMKDSARLVLFDLHWFYPGKCIKRFGPLGKCFRWNRPSRVGVVREALHMAAACTDTPIYSNLGIYKALPTKTQDGVHYEHPIVWGLEADVLLNALCPRGGGGGGGEAGEGVGPMSFIPPDRLAQCNERVAFSRWSGNPQAMYCPGDFGQG